LQNFLSLAFDFSIIFWFIKKIKNTPLKNKIKTNYSGNGKADDKRINLKNANIIMALIGQK